MAIKKPIAIAEARRLGEASGADRLVIIALDEQGRVTATSWGKTRRKCQDLGQWLDLHADRVAGHIEGWTFDADDLADHLFGGFD